MCSQGANTSFCQICIIIPEKEFILSVSKWQCLRNVLTPWLHEDVRNIKGCVMSSTGKVVLLLSFDDTVN